MGKVHKLSELVENVNAASSTAAMERYLKGTAHARLKCICSRIEECEESHRNLLAGNLSANLDLCHRADTFTDALTLCPRITYTVCVLPKKDEEDVSDDIYEDFGVDEEIDGETFAKLSKIPTKKLRETLVCDYFCSTFTNFQSHSADEDAQEAYYKAVCSYFEAAAQYAKEIKSESARLWLEALRLISDAYDEDFGYLELDRSRVAEAYQVAERAHQILWVDNKFHNLPKLAKLEQPACAATAGRALWHVTGEGVGLDIKSQFRATKKKGRRGCGLKGSKTKRMEAQLESFKTWISSGNEIDENYQNKTIGSRANQYWRQNHKTMENAAKASGEKRGYSCAKTLADAYRKSS